MNRISRASDLIVGLDISRFVILGVFVLEILQ